MLTKRDFQLPEVPQISGDARKDCQAFREHLLNQQRTILEIFRSFNQPEATSIDMAHIRAAYGIDFLSGNLSDFAFGAWTPGATFTTPGDQNIVLSPALGYYIKIGPLVIAFYRFNSTTFTFTTAAGNFNITNLPFTASSDANHIYDGPATWGGITKAGFTNIACEVLPGTAIGLLTASGSGNAPTVIAAGDMPTGGTLRMRGTFIYRV